LQSLWRGLKPNGVLYVSFKHGTGEREHGGRMFTDTTETQLHSWVQALDGLASTDIWLTADQRPDRQEKWVNGLFRKAPESSPALTGKLTTGGADPFLPKLVHEIAHATHIDISVSFIMTSGLTLLMPDLQAALLPEQESTRQPAKVRVLTGDYLDVTDVEACRLLMLLKDHGAEVRVFEAKAHSFHMKAYIFATEHPELGLSGRAFIGSSNISKQALRTGLEWNYKVEYPGDPGFIEVRQRYEELFAHPHTVELTHEWIDAYDQRRLAMRRPVAPGSFEVVEPPTPTAIQKAALAALAETRMDNFQRGLVVLATGLGKTWLAAFDAHHLGAKKVLFVAHREEILGQAAATFLRIRPNARVGNYAGQRRDAEADVLCASVQTMGKEAHLERFAPTHFDYIVVDEFHHAAAPSYRRLLSYFNPRFLLGLTATPDRTDQSDILSLCDDNLVYTCDLFQGINAHLLAPFHYHGIFDEEVRYEEVPWRNGRFDPNELSNKLATLGRAKHALREWARLKQRRTLAFCVSIRHAEFMAEQFRKAGIAAQAVYGGSELGRVEALDQLSNGKLEVLFSVDLFSEGMDLPLIDTVMMLRPTESKVLFLQQLGRGLRKADADGKTHLVVLDFIGNHQSFLHKPQALFGVGSTFKQLGQFARDAEQKRLTLPEGCFANFDLRLIDFLKSLERPGIQAEYEALRDSLGRRPTPTEAYRAGMSMVQMRRQYGSWFGMLAVLKELPAEEMAVAKANDLLLQEVETAHMTRSFKMVLLEAFQELNGWRNGPALPVLAARSWQVLSRRRQFLGDVPEGFQDPQSAHSEEWVRYWRKNPVDAWIGGNRGNDATALFALSEGRFVSKTVVVPEQIEILQELVQQLIDFRFATYEHRQAAAPAANVIPFVRPVRSGIELPFFPNIRIACGHFKTGTADAEEFRSLGDGHGKLDPQRHFIARASGRSMDGGKNPIRDGDYLLLERLSPGSAGSITGTVMAIERQDESGDNQYLLRVVLKSPGGGYLLRANNPDYVDMEATDDMRTLAKLKEVLDPFELAIGRSFMREEIPPLFGVVFQHGSWNVGHVVLHDQKAHVLLITLNKQGKSEDHKYLDHWIDESTFHWQSQNATTPESSKGRSIIDHQKNGWQIHLFVRETKLNQGTAAPFVYHGPVSYVRHEGSAPMSVTLALPG
jgi:superfamily II DNA or RNA helicase